MTTFPRSPRLLKGGIVLVDPDTGVAQRIIVLQYNPESLSRTLQVQGAGSTAGDRLEALRLTGPPVETIRLEAAIDATDQLEFPGQNRTATEVGIHPQLAALETLVYPPSDRLQINNLLARIGTVEIAPAEAPLTLFVWSAARVVPVRVTDFAVNEEAFDPALNPIRATVTLGLRVLSVNDLGFSHRGGTVYMAYQRQKERLAARIKGGTLGTLGLRGLP